MPEPIKKIFLISADIHAINKLIIKLSPNGNYYWVYFGKNINLCQRIQDNLGNDIKRIFIGDMIQEIASNTREQYIDYIGQLFSNSTSPIWDLTSLSEKSPFSSNFLLNYCYIEVCKKILLNYVDGEIIIICENDALRESLLVNVSKEPRVIFKIIESSQFRKTTQKIWKYFLTVKWKIDFCYRNIARILLAKCFGLIKGHSLNDKGKSKYILIHSWTDKRCFPKKGVFKNVYFGDVGVYLEKKYPNVIYLSDVLPSEWFFSVFIKLIPVKKNVYLLEEFLSLSDVFRSFFFVLRNYPKLFSIPNFNNVDVSSIVLDEIKQDLLRIRSEKAFLNSLICKRVCNFCNVGIFFFSFENHIWEKIMCKGFRKYCPDAKSIGYAVPFINRMYTVYSLSRLEKNRSTLPDFLFVSGEQGKSILTKSGFDSNKIFVGGAIRYPHFGRFIKTRNKEGKIVLIALSGDISASIELAKKAIIAFSRDSDIKIIIKCHPTVPFKEISYYLPKLPENCSISEEAIDILLNKVNLVLYTESTVCIEAVERGIPVIHVKSDHSIDINIFDGIDSVISCSEPDDILRYSRDILEGTYNLPSEDLIRTIFSPTDVELIDSIINNCLSGSVEFLNENKKR